MFRVLHIDINDQFEEIRRTIRDLQVINVSNHINVMQYYYRTKTDPNTGDQVGVERRPLQMFPLIITAGLKFEF